MEINVRLEYKDFFKEEKKDILDYLKQISRDTLERFIGWSAVSNVELGNFFTDKKCLNVYNLNIANYLFLYLLVSIY